MPYRQHRQVSARRLATFGTSSHSPRWQVLNAIPMLGIISQLCRDQNNLGGGGKWMKPAHVTDLEEYGYAVVPKFLTSNEVATLRGAVDQVYAEAMKHRCTFRHRNLAAVRNPERRVRLPPLPDGGRAIPLHRPARRLALPEVPPRHQADGGGGHGAHSYAAGCMGRVPGKKVGLSCNPPQVLGIMGQSGTGGTASASRGTWRFWSRCLGATSNRWQIRSTGRNRMESTHSIVTIRISVTISSTCRSVRRYRAELDHDWSRA